MAADPEGIEVVICKKLEDSDVALGDLAKGLRVLNEEYGSTRNVNPLLALPDTMSVMDEFEEIWEMEVKKRSDGLYITSDWYFFVDKRDPRAGDTIKIWRFQRDITKNRFHITIQRDDNSSTDSEGVEVVICKKLEDREVSFGEGLRVLNEEFESTSAPGRNVNPLLALPTTTVLITDELKKEWKMKVVKRSDGVYITARWYMFVSKHKLKVGDTIKIWKYQSDITGNKFQITIQRDDNSSTDSK